jgi:hypothetical protein
MLTDEETSTSNSILIKKYWHLDIDGSDNLTSYNRLIKFLEADQAKYLYMFIGTIVNGKRTDCDRGKVISECLLYFQNNGIQYRSKAQIRHRLSRLMKEFGEAHELSYTPEANIEGSDVNSKSKLEYYLVSVMTNIYIKGKCLHFVLRMRRYDLGL